MVSLKVMFYSQSSYSDLMISLSLLILRSYSTIFRCSASTLLCWKNYLVKKGVPKRRGGKRQNNLFVRGIPANWVGGPALSTCKVVSLIYILQFARQIRNKLFCAIPLRSPGCWLLSFRLFSLARFSAARFIRCSSSSLRSSEEYDAVGRSSGFLAIKRFGSLL